MASAASCIASTVVNTDRILQITSKNARTKSPNLSFFKMPPAREDIFSGRRFNRESD
jgi:hypothetical protein